MEPELNYFPETESTSNIIPSANGSVMKGGSMQSGNFAVGVSGWRITAAGELEASSGTFRGSITATSGTIGGFVIGATTLTGGTSLSFSSTGTGIITSGTIRTASSGTRVEMSGTNNRLDVYNSSSNNIGWFGGAGANGNFMYISQPDTNEDFPPIYVTSAQDSNVLSIHNTNSTVANRPAVRIESNNTNSLALYVTGVGTAGNSSVAFNNSGDSPALSLSNSSNSYGTLFLTQSGSSAFIYVASNAAQLTKAGVWTDASSRLLKENFENISVLNKLKTLDIIQYNYKVDAPRSMKDISDRLIEIKKKDKYYSKNKDTKGIRSEKDYVNETVTRGELDEIGLIALKEFESEKTKRIPKHFTPMAEDFYNIFGIGDSDKGISPNDTAGVALQAVKELLERIEVLEKNINK